MTEKLEYPECIGGPPVTFVSIKNHGGVSADATALHKRFEASSVYIVTSDSVVEIGVPIDLDRAWNVSGFVEQNILVGFNYNYVWVV